MRSVMTVLFSLLVLLQLESGLLFGQSDIRKMLSSGRAGPITQECTLPFHLEGHRIQVPIGINQRPEVFTFGLDTGAYTWIDASLATRLGLPRAGEIPGIGGKMLDLVQLGAIRLGDILVEDLLVPVVDIRQTIGEDLAVDGLIGSDFLRFFRLSVDYQKQQIIIGPSRSSTPASPALFWKLNIGLPLRFPMLDIALADLAAIPAMIDTGSPFELVLPLSFFSRLGEGTKAQALRAKGVFARWPGASPGPTYLARIEKFKMGQWEISHLLVLFTNLPGAFQSGLIGKGLLDRAVFTIDYPTSLMTCASPPGQKPRSNLLAIGLICQRGSDNRTLVRGVWENSPADRAGIEPGSEILSINGRPARSLSLAEVSRMLEDDSITLIDLKMRQGDSTRDLQLEKKYLFPNTDE